MPSPARLAFIEAEMARCQSTCVICEREPTRQGQTRCDGCAASIDEREDRAHAGRKWSVIEPLAKIAAGRNGEVA